MPPGDLDALLPPPFRARGEHVFLAHGSASVLFTTRRGGCSRGPYASLNLGRATGDDPAAVERNRDRLQQADGVGFAHARQVHGIEVALADAPTDSQSHAGELPEADGQLTRARGVAPMVLTADCLPVAVIGRGAVAMLHAGWRGLAGGILQRGVELVREGAAGGPLAGAIGPGARGCCYEVGEEVHAHFAHLPGVRHGRRLDTAAVAAQLLRRAGVGEIHDCGLCTICTDPSLFFSHRRDRGLTGRQAGIAWLS